MTLFAGASVDNAQAIELAVNQHSTMVESLPELRAFVRVVETGGDPAVDPFLDGLHQPAEGLLS